jgi:hypothetical protein
MIAIGAIAKRIRLRFADNNVDCSARPVAVIAKLADYAFGSIRPTGSRACDDHRIRKRLICAHPCYARCDQQPPQFHQSKSVSRPVRLFNSDTLHSASNYCLEVLNLLR